MTDARLFRLLRLSIGAAVATITLKVLAWSLTGSVGLLSDAAESVVNLVAAIVALLALRWGAKPADEGRVDEVSIYPRPTRPHHRSLGYRRHPLTRASTRTMALAEPGSLRRCCRLDASVPRPRRPAPALDDEEASALPVA